MTVRLEVRRISGLIVAALVDNRIDGYVFGGHVAFAGQRMPLAVLIRDGDRVTAFGAGGARLSLAQVRAEYPDEVAQVMAM